MGKRTMAVYIGRFQPFHQGHVAVLKRALEKYDLVQVIIGSAWGARTVKNPFTHAERMTVIRNWAIAEGFNSNLRIAATADFPNNDNAWIAQIQEIVANNSGFIDVDVSLVGSDRDDSTWYLNVFPQWKTDLSEPFPDGSNLNATELRHRLFGESLKPAKIKGLFPEAPSATIDFLEKFVKTDTYQALLKEEACIRDYKQRWSVAPYAPTFVTADAVVIQSGHVLVVERGEYPGKGLWALPGGFVNQNERVKNAAIRELIEETGLKLQEVVMERAFRAMEIFDHPDRSLRGRTITFALLFRLDDTKPLPRVKGQNAPLAETGGIEVVETAKAFWLPLHEALNTRDKWFEDHLEILRWASTKV